MKGRVVVDLDRVGSGRKGSTIEVDSLRIPELDGVVVLDVRGQHRKGRRTGSVDGQRHSPGERADKRGKRQADGVLHPVASLLVRH